MDVGGSDTDKRQRNTLGDNTVETPSGAQALSELLGRTDGLSAFMMPGGGKRLEKMDEDQLRGLRRRLFASIQGLADIDAEPSTERLSAYGKRARALMIAMDPYYMQRKQAELRGDIMNRMAYAASNIVQINKMLGVGTHQKRVQVQRHPASDR
jgi:hypothetical protein